jgi:hypothetical protein
MIMKSIIPCRDGHPENRCGLRLNYSMALVKQMLFVFAGLQQAHSPNPAPVAGLLYDAQAEKDNPASAILVSRVH